jgi:hypothetical protein
MADSPDQDGRERSDETAKLELPSLSLRRRRKKAPPDPASVDEDTTEVTRPPAAEPEPAVETEPAPEPAPRPVPREPRWRLPVLNPWVATVVTGLVVGLAGTVLTYLSLQGCQAVRGTQTCGGPGVGILVVILALMALLGGVLLAWWKVSENPRATSLLAIGVLCVVVMVTLLEELFSGWMFLVVPVLAVVSYLIAQWVTTRYVELPEHGPEHDIR